MFGKPGTKAELAALEYAAGRLRFDGDSVRADLLDSLRAKLTAPFKARPDLPDVRAIQEALALEMPVRSASEPWWASQARKAAAVGATVADAPLVGRWLATCGWARGMTIDRVLAGWPSYLARARAWEARGEREDTTGRRDFRPDG